MGEIVIVLKTQDSSEPPNAVLARLEEHLPDGPGIGIFLDLSGSFDNSRAKAWALIDGEPVGLLPCVVIPERDE